MSKVRAHSAGGRLSLGRGAVTVYVDPAGDDANSGLTAAAPLESFAAALTTVESGQIVALKRGATFTDELDITVAGITVTAYGSGADPIIDRAGQGVAGARGDWGISIRADDVTVEQVTVRNVHEFGIRLRGASNCTLRNLTVHAIDQNGIYAYDPDGEGSGGHTITGCDIYDCGEAGDYGEGNGMQFANTLDTPCTITDCTIHDLGAFAGDHGIYYEGAAGGVIADNVFYNIEGAGAKTRVECDIRGNRFRYCKVAAAYSDGGNDVQIRFNSAYNCGRYPLGASPYVAYWMTSVGTGSEITDNIATGSGIGLQVTGTNTPTVDRNCVTATVRYGHWKGTDCASLAAWQTASSQSANDVNSNPLYTDPENGDLTLQGGSPAAGKGYESAP